MSQRPIPVLDLAPGIDSLWTELNDAIQEVLRSGQFIMGPAVRDFEADFAAYLGVRHAVGLNSGTDALVIALRALGIGPGDEVITTAFTFFATAEAISILGAIPVFVDVDPVTFNLDASQIKAHITPRTRAILPVHLYGHAAAMDPILEIAAAHNLPVLEDVAQAFGGSYHGRKLGTLGKVSAFSFFPTKNLGAFGDAGLLATDDDALAEQARMLRAHGGKKKYANEILGYNSRLDTLQAAILRVKLPYVDSWNEARRLAARRYTELLSGMPDIIPPQEMPGICHVYHQYTIRILNGRRDAVQQRLKQNGIDTMIYYPTPVHQLPVYAASQTRLPVTEQLAGEVLSLPIWPELDEAAQAHIITCLQAALDV